MARWIASDILAERGVERTPVSMRAVLPVAYVFADGVLGALGEVTGELAAELADATAVIRCRIPAGHREGVDMGEFEAEFPCEGPEPESGGV